METYVSDYLPNYQRGSSHQYTIALCYLEINPLERLSLDLLFPL